MFRPSPARVRFALLGIFTVLAVALTVDPVRSQPGRPPGFPGGGVGGIPGGGIGGVSGGGIGGIPGGGITGFPGGVTGFPGGLPGMPSPPTMPNPGRTERVWTCGKCNRELGRGLAPPAVSKCPGCGVRLVGVDFGTGLPGMTAPPSMPGMPATPGGFAGTPSVPGAVPPHATTPGGSGGGPELPARPDDGGIPLIGTPAPGTTAPSYTPSSDPAPAASGEATPAAPAESGGKTGRVLKIIAIAGGVGLVLVVVGMLVAVSRNAGGGRPVKRFRPRRDD